MRQGELMGLEWKHFDLDKKTISIQQCAQYLPGKGIFLKDPKNETSKRLISVPASVMELLKRYKKEQAAERLQMGDKWQASDRLFTTWDGRPMYPNEMSSWFPKFLKRHKLPHLNFHGLRHTSATLLIAEGATATDLSRRLGHSNTSTTMNIYAHSLQKADNVLASKMDNILSGKKKSAKKGQAK
jgi:integrase